MIPSRSSERRQAASNRNSVIENNPEEQEISGKAIGCSPTNIDRSFLLIPIPEVPELKNQGEPQHEIYINTVASYPEVRNLIPLLAALYEELKKVGGFMVSLRENRFGKIVQQHRDLFGLSSLWSNDFELNLSKAFTHYLKIMLPYEMLMKRPQVPRMNKLKFTRVMKFETFKGLFKHQNLPFLYDRQSLVIQQYFKPQAHPLEHLTAENYPYSPQTPIAHLLPKQLHPSFIMNPDPYFTFLGRADALSYLPVLPPEFQPKLIACGVNSQISNIGNHYKVGTVVVNHGPGVMNWMVIHKDDVGKKGKDFWVENLDEIAYANLPVSIFSQAPGDLVYLGSKSIYWARSKEQTIIAQWHIMPKTVQSFQESVQNSQQLLPFKFMAMNILNHQFRSLHPTFLKPLHRMVQRWYQSQQQLITTKTSKKTIPFPQLAPSPNRFCQHCHRQIFTLYSLFEDKPTCPQCTPIDLALSGPLYTFFEFKYLNALILITKVHWVNPLPPYHEIYHLCEVGGYAGRVKCYKKRQKKQLEALEKEIRARQRGYSRSRSREKHQPDDSKHKQSEKKNSPNNQKDRNRKQKEKQKRRKMRPVLHETFRLYIENGTEEIASPRRIQTSIPSVTQPQQDRRSAPVPVPKSEPLPNRAQNMPQIKNITQNNHSPQIAGDIPSNQE